MSSGIDVDVSKMLEMAPADNRHAHVADSLSKAYELFFGQLAKPNANMSNVDRARAIAASILSIVLEAHVRSAGADDSGVLDHAAARKSIDRHEATTKARDALVATSAKHSDHGQVLAILNKAPASLAELPLVPTVLRATSAVRRSRSASSPSPAQPESPGTDVAIDDRFVVAVTDMIGRAVGFGEVPPAFAQLVGTSS